MTTHKQMMDKADELSKALSDLTGELSRGGLALSEFTNAFKVQKEWSELKLKRSFERIINAQNFKPRNKVNN